MSEKPEILSLSQSRRITAQMQGRIAKLEDMLCRAGSRLKATNNMLIDAAIDGEFHADNDVNQGLLDEINALLRGGH